jgi:protoheme IX farnesyltransferase
MHASGRPDVRRILADRLELTKPRITLMVVLTALVGFVMASPRPLPTTLLAATLVGTGLVAAGAAIANQILERDSDALMLRTRRRPLPAGRVRTPEAVLAASLATLAGLAVLLWRCGPPAAGIALLTWSSYLFLYTPLKKRTPLATLVGAVPGALPPVIGWAAAEPTLGVGALVLFTILYLWQVPHFLAIAWLYRDDYARAGFPMLPVLDREGSFTARQAVLHSTALLLVSLAPAATGMAGAIYLTGASLLGLALTLVALRLLAGRNTASARLLFLSSVVYLPALSSLLMAGRP